MSATSVVEKATSDMLIGPDWALNLDLCDAINNEPSQAREIVKAVKKRLTNKNPQIQLLALTVLETLIKNCGDHVHQQVAEKDVLHELVKIVKKKADMRVRDKTLVLLDSWQEAFGGPNGRYPQYYIAYSELQKLGVDFPRRGVEASVPIFTPPQSQPIVSPRPPHQQGPWSSGASTPRTEDTENVPSMRLADIQSAHNLVEVLQEMVAALNPRDRMSAKEEVIVEIVDQCRLNQHRVMQLVNTTSEEELLRQGLSLNDELQRVLARYDTFLSGSPMPEESHQSKSRSHRPEKPSLEDPSLLSPRVQTQSEAQISPPGNISRPKSARTIFPALPLPPPPSSSIKRNSQTSTAVSARPGDATLDLLSGDLPDSQPAVSSSASATVDRPPQVHVDLLALPAPEGFQNPFESSPFHATPATEALSPVSPPQTFQQQADTPLQRPENSWSAAPVTSRQNSFYNDMQAQSPESVSGQPVQGQSQYYYGHSQPVVKTPPPWQEDIQAPQVDQQWQGASQPSYPWTGGNTTQMWNSGQQMRMGGMQQSPGTGFTGFGSQLSLPASYQSPHQVRGASELSRTSTGPGENFGSLYLQQRGSAYGQSSGSLASQQQGGPAKSVKTPEMLFDDLVDLRSAKFKANKQTNKVQTPNTSKAGP